jgi:hypothetical protein
MNNTASRWTGPYAGTLPAALTNCRLWRPALCRGCELPEVRSHRRAPPSASMHFY